jgi:hypothetical protein
MLRIFEKFIYDPDPDPKPIEKYDPDPKKTFRIHNTVDVFDVVCRFLSSTQPVLLLASCTTSA